MTDERLGPYASVDPHGLVPEEPRGSTRSILPGAAVVGVLLAVAIFAAGYTLGQRGDARSDDGLEAISEAYERIGRDYVGELDPDALVADAIGAMFESLGDPYSSYMGADRFDEDLATVSGEFEGIGAEMLTGDAMGEPCEPLDDSCSLVVVGVIAGSPAEESGLLAGDVVVTIDDRPVSGLTLGDATGLIKGESGTDVQLGIRREGLDVPLTITRELIREQDVRSAVLAEGRVGYLRIDTFSVAAADDFHGQLRAHLDAGIRDLVVDVRDDPGGFVDTAVTMASEFIADGPLYQERFADGDRRVIEARAGGLATDPAIDVAVLIDDGSASASEILAGALGGRDRATLVGETTFGKGTIQEWTELPGDNGGFRLSVARWLLPDGTSVDEVGIAPDIEVIGPDVAATIEDAAALAQDPVVQAGVAAVLGEGADVAASVDGASAPPGSGATLAPAVASPLPLA